ncbi:hypothetical protein, partial [Enhydrobacter aerosaccus]|uniref:hypothetical protein n=1 Tax=Enhydrobacter aerosaccus TaxID=225324 RepID=UPI001482AACF
SACDTLEAELSGRDTRIRELEATSNATASEVTRLEEELSNLNTRVACLEPLAGFIVEAEALRLMLSELDGRIHGLQETNVLLEGRAASLEADKTVCEATILAKEQYITELAATTQTHAATENALKKQIADCLGRERELQQTIEAQIFALKRLQEAWIFKLDSLLVRRIKTSAFGLAKRRPLLLAPGRP